ncbi:MAG: hypothetical protein WCP58_11035 [bacterium]
MVPLATDKDSRCATDTRSHNTSNHCATDTGDHYATDTGAHPEAHPDYHKPDAHPEAHPDYHKPDAHPEAETYSHPDANSFPCSRWYKSCLGHIPTRSAAYGAIPVRRPNHWSSEVEVSNRRQDRRRPRDWPGRLGILRGDEWRGLCG